MTAAETGCSYSSVPVKDRPRISIPEANHVFEVAEFKSVT